MADSDEVARISKADMLRVLAAVERIERDFPSGAGPSGRSRQTDQRIITGKSTEAISQGNSGDVAVYGGDGSDKGGETETGETVEAYARLGDVDNDTWVYLLWVAGGWEVMNTECT